MSILKFKLKKYRFFLTIPLSIAIILILGQTFHLPSPLPQIEGISIANKFLNITGAEVDAAVSSPYQDISGDVAISGNVGIGTTSPGHKLEVIGLDNHPNIFRVGEGTESHIKIDGDTNITRLSSHANYKLSIGGTTAPTDKVTVYEANKPIISFVTDRSGTDWGIAKIGKNATGEHLYLSTNLQDTTYKNGGQYGTLDNTSMYGSFLMLRNGMIRFYTTNSTGTGDQLMTQVFSVDRTGNITAKSLTETSDQRFKKNITKLTNVLDKVNLISGVSFDWLVTSSNPNLPQKKQIGLIAQDLEKQFPELVNTDENGYKSVDYSRFTAVLLEAIKEQSQEISQLKQEVQTLKSGKNEMK